VHRLLFDGARVTGVLCAREDRLEQVRANRGVVLSAGAVESPKLLMLSGIGPAADLRRHGIAVRVDAPEVGANLQDRPRVALRWRGRTTLPASSVSAGLFTWAARDSGGGPPDIAFFVGRGVDAPDEFITITVALGAPRPAAARSRCSRRIPRPRRSSGRNYLQEPRDMDLLVEGARLARALGEATAVRAAPRRARRPGHRLVIRDTLRDFIRRTADTIYHPAGTCRMGRDARAVVDPHLRVRGVERLWVADASIMPDLPNAQLHAACVMIGERASDILRG
jgi:choline dehydrogenase